MNLDFVSSNTSLYGEKNLIAALDIGSNAVRFSVAKKKKSSYKLLHRMRIPLRFGADVFSTGFIDGSTVENAIHIFKLLKEYKASHQIETFRATATSAFRDAKNAQEVIKRIHEKSGIHIEVIDGQEEAKMIFNAVKSQLKLENNRALLIDIGGGSLELTYYNGRKISATKSFDIGTVRLLNKPRILSGMKKDIREFLKKNVPDQDEFLIIGTGGNLRRLGKLRRKIFNKTNSAKVKTKEISEIEGIIKELSIEERMKQLDMRKDRAEVISPAIDILKACLENLKAEEMLLPNVGLIDGIFTSLISNRPYN